MSEDSLPYWKFFAQKWTSGNIQAHDMETQGIFLNLCARAWQDGGYVQNNTDKLARLLRVDKQTLANAIHLLIEDDLLVENDDGSISSKFILLQLEDRCVLSHKRSEAGRKGGKAKQLNRRSKCRASAKQTPSIKELESESELESENKNPPNPLKGDVGTNKLSEAEKKRFKVAENTPMMVSLGKLFRRQATSLWSLYEAEALEQLGEIDEYEVHAIQKYYAAKFPEDKKDYRRKNLETVLNNWSGEVDRAVGYIEMPQAPVIRERQRLDLIGGAQ